MRIAVLAAAAILAGCQSTADLQARVGNASNFQLCRAIMLAPTDVANIARAEVQRRQFDCTPIAASIIQSERASDAAAMEMSRRLLTPAPLPQRPFPTHCRSVRMGNAVNTVCD